MVDVNLEELTRKLQDRFTDMLFATIEEYMPKKQGLPSVNPQVSDNADVKALTWAPKEGDKGPYELCNQFENPEFHKLAESLIGTGGRGFKDGVFYWLFKDEKAIGRKKTKPKA